MRIHLLIIASTAAWLSTSSIGCKREDRQAQVDPVGEAPPARSASAGATVTAPKTTDSKTAGNDAGADFGPIGEDARSVQLRGSKRDLEEVSKIAAVYEMTEVTENKQSCSGEGMSALEQRKQRRFVLLYKESGLKSPYLASCPTIPECRALAAAVRAGGSAPPPELTQGFTRVSGRRLNGAREQVGDWDFKEGCANAFQGKAKLTWNDEQMTLELRGQAFDYQREAACNREELQAQAKDKPCNRLIVIRAKRVASLS